MRTGSRRGFSSVVAGLVPLKYETTVRAAETEAVGGGILDRHRPSLVRHIVEVALRIRVFEVDRRRRNLVAQSQDRNAGLEAARTAEQMAGHRFRRTDGQFCRMVTEGPLHGTGF